MQSKLSSRTRRAAAHVGGLLRAAREAAELSQEALARKIGMTRGNLARIEHGQTNVTLDSLLRIAQGLGLSLTFDLGMNKRKRPSR